jgi:hypothetical protein
MSVAACSVDARARGTPQSNPTITLYPNPNCTHARYFFKPQVGARRLVMTHFSPRYKGDLSPESLGIMKRLEDMARRVSECVCAFLCVCMCV